MFILHPRVINPTVSNWIDALTKETQSDIHSVFEILRDFVIDGPTCKK